MKIFNAAMKKLNGANKSLVAGIAFVFAVMSFVSGCSESMNSPYGSGNE
jgi:hypothetical protein